MSEKTESYKYLGDFSATPPQYTRHMECHDCKVSWGGCWDNFQCPKCGEGELPKNHVCVPWRGRDGNIGKCIECGEAVDGQV